MNQRTEIVNVMMGAGEVRVVANDSTTLFPITMVINLRGMGRAEQRMSVGDAEDLIDCLRSQVAWSKENKT